MTSHPISRRKFASIVGFGLSTPAAILRSNGAAAQINKSGAGGLAPPSNGSFLVPIIRQLELDKKYGLPFDINLYSDPSALYSDLAAARTSHIFGAIYNCANFYVRGIPLKLLFTISTANHAFIAKDPKISTASDLKGKTIAATTSSGFYGMGVLFLKQNGLDPRRDINIINSAPSGVQTQLLAGKVDAGLLFDPSLSTMLAQGYHIVGDMSGSIRSHLMMPKDAPVWYLGAYARQEWIDANPTRAIATFRMWQDAADFYNTNADEADKMISAFAKVSLEALRLSRSRGITQFSIKPAEAEKENLNAMFRGLQEVGFLKELPDDAIYHRWQK